MWLIKTHNKCIYRIIIIAMFLVSSKLVSGFSKNKNHASQMRKLNAVIKNIYTLNIPEPSEVEIEDLKLFLKNKASCLVITGAGCSTESGIPDYRGPNGSYKRGSENLLKIIFIFTFNEISLQFTLIRS